MFKDIFILYSSSFIIQAYGRKMIFLELKKKLGDIHFYHIFYNMLRENKGYSFT